MWSGIIGHSVIRSACNRYRTRVQAIAATPDPPSITLDDIRAVQAEDDNLVPVIQPLLDQAQPAHADLRQYPEEARVLLAQWDSLVLQDGTLHRNFHYPDGTVNCMPNSDTLVRQRRVMPCHAEPTSRVGDHILDC